MLGAHEILLANGCVRWIGAKHHAQLWLAGLVQIARISRQPSAGHPPVHSAAYHASWLSVLHGPVDSSNSGVVRVEQSEITVILLLNAASQQHDGQFRAVNT